MKTTIRRSLTAGQVGGSAAWSEAQGPGRGGFALVLETPRQARQSSLAELMKHARIVDLGITDLASNPEHLNSFDREPPLEVARTESGARVVEQLLAKIDWGAAA